MSTTVEHEPETAVERTPVRPVVRRFTSWTRATHAVLAASVFGLVLTGMPMRYQDAFWAHWLFWLERGHDQAAALHKCFAVGFFSAGAMHVGGTVAAWLTGRFKLRSILEPDSILLRPQDFLNITGNLRFLHDRGPRPDFSRFTYWEKFDYFAVFWGVMVIGSTGLFLWFPEFFTKVLPGSLINVATIIHSDEALLAVAFIFTIHFFNVHLRPEKFPLDAVMFTGRATKEYMEEEHPGVLESIEALSAQPVQATPVVDAPAPPPSRRQSLVGAVLGFIALAVGLVLIGMILWVALS